MHDGRAANERAEEADHEIDRVIRRQNTEIAIPGREWIERRERDALLQIIVVLHHAALRASAGTRRIDDGREIAAVARRENRRLRLRLRVFPALRSIEISVRRRFGDIDEL